MLECKLLLQNVEGGGGGLKNGSNDGMKNSHLELRSLGSFFWGLMQETVRRSRYMIWLTFYIERVRAHRIKIIDNSCFHNRWPTSKTKQK